MAAEGSSELDRLDPRDRDYVERLDDAAREVVVSTILRYQRPGKLGVGDPLPELPLHVLDGPGTVRVSELPGGRPLVLVFGSFT